MKTNEIAVFYKLINASILCNCCRIADDKTVVLKFNFTIDEGMHDLLIAACIYFRSPVLHCQL